MSVRNWGSSPYKVVVIHGGPGAHGSMADVARETCKSTGTLEPMQTAVTIAGQVEELRGQIEEHGDPPVVLIGHSWGAWLATIFAARYPEMVRKLLLVGCGPFEPQYGEHTLPTRLSRMCPEDRVRCLDLMRRLHHTAEPDREAVAAELGGLMHQTDAFAPLPPKEDPDALPFHPEGFAEIMAEVQQMRREGDLLKIAGEVRCPVVAIHGDYDPHPAEGVREPLSRLLADFRMVVLEKCGHDPWNERHARDAFFEILEQELQ